MSNAVANHHIYKHYVELEQIGRKALSHQDRESLAAVTSQMWGILIGQSLWSEDDTYDYVNHSLLFHERMPTWSFTQIIKEFNDMDYMFKKFLPEHLRKPQAIVVPK